MGYWRKNRTDYFLIIQRFRVLILSSMHKGHQQLYVDIHYSVPWWDIYLSIIIRTNQNMLSTVFCLKHMDGIKKLNLTTIWDIRVYTKLGFLIYRQHMKCEFMCWCFPPSYEVRTDPPPHMDSVIRILYVLSHEKICKILKIRFYRTLCSDWCKRFQVNIDSGNALAPTGIKPLL